MTIYCTRCGEGIGSSARFCQRCGTEAPELLEGFSPPEPAPAMPAPPDVTPVLMGGYSVPGWRRLGFRFDGEVVGLFLLYARGVLLTLLTLGVYNFWARAAIRRYLAAHTRFDRAPFAFSGTGLELALGFLRALALLALVLAGVITVNVAGRNGFGMLLGILLFYGAMFALAPVMLVGAWRYRMSRTSLRGIRFAFHGTIGECAKVVLLGGLLSSVTWIYAPWFLNSLRRFYVTNSSWGTARFEYDGEGSDLMLPYMISTVLILPTLGLSWLWFKLRKHNYYWEHTTFQGARFRSSVEFGEYFSLQVTNLLAVIFTLGLAWPWAKARSLRFTLERLYVEGIVDMEQILQQITDASAAGEAASGLLDFGSTDLGLGM